jgi:hypothetical protein
MPKALELEKTRAGCAMFENTPRYRVLLHGKQVGELYFNMRGYVGNLPLPDGSWLAMPESGITAYRREVAQINREFKKLEGGVGHAASN